MIRSRWSSDIYPCSDPNCGFIGLLDAFSNGECYDPCPACGAKRVQRTGRFIYEAVEKPFLIFFKRRKLIRVGVEWRSNDNT